MDVAEFLVEIVSKLESLGIPTARLDTLVLLEDATGKDRAWLLAHPEFTVQGTTLYTLNEQIEKRANHTPLAYIRGKSEFYGREFLVTPDTLQPRAETETMLDLLCKLLKWHFPSLLEVGPPTDAVNVTFVDVGTGSGCIAITAKLEFPKAEVYATEINEAALKIATKNAKNLKADITFLRGDLLEPFSKIQDQSSKIAILLCNLPYVPDNHTINPAAMQEPKVAIFGGEDGLDLYRDMFEQIKDSDTKPQYILTESLPFQHENLAKIASQHGYNQIVEEDFIQVFTRQNS